MRVMQGDGYPIPFEISDQLGSPITPEQVDVVEIVIGSLTKSYPSEVSYSEGKFFFPLTQEETFAMRSEQPVQVRLKFSTGEVVGKSLGVVDVFESLSQEVL